MDILKEFWDFLKERKKIWIVPLILMLGALALLAVAVAGSAPGLAPFIYAMF